MPETQRLGKASPNQVKHADGASGIETLPIPARPDQAAPLGDRLLGVDLTTFSTLFVGDVGFGEHYLHHPRAKELQSMLVNQGYAQSLSRLAPRLASADLVIGNLEVPLSSCPEPALKTSKKYLSWCDPHRTLEALHAAGFAALSLANNHSIDCGRDAMIKTTEMLTGAGIEAFGAGTDVASAAAPFIRTICAGGRRQTLVVFAAHERRARYEKRYRWYADSGVPGVNALSPQHIAAAIDALRPHLPSPIFVAFPHWGVDYQPVTDAQKRLARELVSAGVDLVIGHGTHTGQSVEMVKGRPVIYGLGNFVWNTPGRYDKLDAAPFSMMASLTLGGDAGGVVRTLRLFPIVTDNAITKFRNRPVNNKEFSRAADFFTSELPFIPRRGCDGEAMYVELELSP